MSRLIRQGFQFCFLIAALGCLTACMNIATTGAQAVYNRQPLTKSFEDQYIALQAYRALEVKTDSFENANIAVSVYHHEVLLAGQVPLPEQKEQAEGLVKTIPGVEHVYNLLRVASPSSTLTKISDTWTTTKIKTRLLASSTLDATQIKVVTENGIVYLMGTLPIPEAQEAVRIASDTNGVLAVVKLFSYLTVSKSPVVLNA